MTALPPPGKPPSASRGMLKRFALAFVAIVVLSSTATAVAALMEVKKDADILNLSEAVDAGTKEALADVKDSGPRTIMILGSDVRAQDGKNAKSRADTVMLVRLDPDKGATSVMSLPRDLRVTLPNGGIDKLNAAYFYGGEEGTIKTVQKFLGPHSPDGKFPINHVINIKFGAFQRAVNYLGCVYADIDRRYFNNNNPPNGGGGRYATIDIDAGYQRLCGSDALDFVRYRHFDSDLVRAARQQEFLRQAKDQIGINRLIENREELLRIVARYMKTDIRGSRTILKLAKLVYKSSEKPLREIQFPTATVDTYVTANDAQLDRAVNRFMNADLGVSAPKAPTVSDADREKPGQAKKKKKKNATTTLPPGIIPAKSEGEAVAVALQTKMTIPVLFPRVKAKDSITRTTDTLDSRQYVIKDKQNHKYPSYRIVIKTSLVGQNYGVQGTTWKNPPILEEEDERRMIGNREFRIFKDGNRIRLIGLKNSNGSYWVSNTLLQSLSNKQMIAIARSLGKLGTK